MEGRRPPAPETSGQAYERLIGKAVEHTLAMERYGFDESNPLYVQEVENMAVVRDEWAKKRFNPSMFDLVVHDRIQQERQKTP